MSVIAQNTKNCCGKALKKQRHVLQLAPNSFSCAEMISTTSVPVANHWSAMVSFRQHLGDEGVLTPQNPIFYVELHSVIPLL
jgi:hypothetical protein